MRIEGIPSHLKLVAYRYGNAGENALDYSSAIPRPYRLACISTINLAIVEVDNIYRCWDLTKIELAEGYERAGDTQNEWFRRPVFTEDMWIGKDLRVHSEKICGTDFPCSDPFPSMDDDRRIIVRPIKPKTKRVLVVECAEPWHNGNPISITVQFHGQVLPATSYRIEERPA